MSRNAFPTLDLVIAFTSIASCRMDEQLGRQRLIIDYHAQGQAKKQNRKISYKDFKAAQPGVDFIPSFQKYYGRYLTAKKYHEQKDKPEAEEDP